MQHRLFGQTGFKVSEMGLGCWQLGADWGMVSENTAMDILRTAWEQGIAFFDTADVYGSGRSEEFVGRFLKELSGECFVATKVGRSPDLYPDRYSEKGVRSCVEASLRRLGVEALDLIQLHCIPTEVMAQGDVFDWLRRLQQEGKIKNFGASVESMDEALLCMRQEGLGSLQIIFNIFRQKPIETIFEKAQEKKIAIIVRLPLASGLLTGKFAADTSFAENDHRNYNRDGAMFNVGETFAGLPFEKGVQLANTVEPLVPADRDMAQMALRWILDFETVSVVIPGATRPEQAIANARVSDLPPLDPILHMQLKDLYIKKVHDHIRGPY